MGRTTLTATVLGLALVWGCQRPTGDAATCADVAQASMLGSSGPRSDARPVCPSDATLRAELEQAEHRLRMNREALGRFANDPRWSDATQHAALTAAKAQTEDTIAEYEARVTRLRAQLRSR